MVNYNNNEFDPKEIVEYAASALYSELLISNLMWQCASTDRAYRQENTVNIRVPGRLAACDRKLRAEVDDRRIQMDFLTETKIGVQFTESLHSALPITSKELSLDSADFASKVVAPQMCALAGEIEKISAQLLVNATYEDGIDEAGTEAAKFKGTLKAEDFFGAGKNGMYDLFLQVHATLNARHVPPNNRVVVMGPGFERLLLTEPQLVKYSDSGDSNALPNARVGRLAGFEFVVSNAVPANEAYAFHKTAFVMAMGAEVIPAGAEAGARTAHKGIALRWLHDYNADYAIDRSLVDCFVGTGIITDAGKLLRAMKITADPAKITAAGEEGSLVKE